MGAYNTLIVLIIVLCTTSTESTGTCPTGDCVIYDISTEANCTEVSFEKPTYDCRWSASLDLNADQVILGGRIVAFRIEAFNGGWTDWFVPGINDIDGKYNVYADLFQSCPIKPKMMGMKRKWAYFYDHNHITLRLTSLLYCTFDSSTSSDVLVIQNE
ncbi:hypothetical protein CHS0354_018216 [Potamilus streckersoni]|uniref:Uncharacterized protein n=1 Tax=Potamilus streckersoni TaxID=2493646 RepID=A0AAE0VK81_9BIVA|nr:hypothetical protein CHS0354_018216 [Potamilus streckersoni]